MVFFLLRDRASCSEQHCRSICSNDAVTYKVIGFGIKIPPDKVWDLLDFWTFVHPIMLSERTARNRPMLELNSRWCSDNTGKYWYNGVSNLRSSVACRDNSDFSVWNLNFSHFFYGCETSFLTQADRSEIRISSFPKFVHCPIFWNTRNSVKNYSPAFLDTARATLKTVRPTILPFLRVH
jgi:hypothetical protein